MTDFNAQVSAALADFMTERGITQVATAKRLGGTRSQGYVSHRLTGKNALSADIIEAVAALAHVSPRALWLELLARTEPVFTEPGAPASSLTPAGSESGATAQSVEDKQRQAGPKVVQPTRRTASSRGKRSHESS